MKKEQNIVINYKNLLNDFLSIREWTDELEDDAESSVMTLSTGIKCGDQGGRLILTGNYGNGLIDVFIYLDQQCKEGKLDQMAVLLNGIHQRWSYGRFMVFSDGYVRWQHRVDFEGCNPTADTINNIVQVGWDVMSLYSDTIITVALTKQSAADALKEFDVSQNSETNDDGEGPSEL
jgi:hypothetical protein